MSERTTATFGELLKHARRAASLTQEELASRAGLSARVISDLERNVSHAPRASTVQLLVAALPLSPLEREVFETTARASTAALDEPLVDATEHEPRSAATSALPRLIGRARERAVLEQHLEHGPRLLVVSGEAGIGKTRLLQEVAHSAPARGWRVVAGSGLALGRDTGSRPIAAAVRQELLQRRSPVHLRRDLRGCAWLVRVVPELAAAPMEPLPAVSLASHQADDLAAEAVIRFLANIAGPAGTLLVLDNLHESDSDTLRLMARLVEAAPDTPLRIVAAYSEGHGMDRGGLALLMARLAQAALVRNLKLGPLSAKDAAALLADRLDAGASPSTEWRTRVLADAGGVPFYLVAWAQHHRARRVEMDDDLPWEVQQSVRSRIDSVSMMLRPVLEVISVAGGRAPYGLLVEVTGQPAQQVLQSLEDASRERLVDEADDQMWSFAYGAVQHVVERDMSRARRMMLRQRLQSLTQRVPAPVGRRMPTSARPGVSDPELEERARHLAVLRRQQRFRA